MNDKEHTGGCWCGEWHDPEKFAVECTAPAPQHWAMIEDEPAGVCWEEDHYPDAPQLVSVNIGSVTCVKCLQFYITMNDLKREAATPQVMPTLKEILKQYGAHHIRDCDALNKWTKLPCNCGFAALIEGTSEQAPPTPDK